MACRDRAARQRRAAAAQAAKPGLTGRSAYGLGDEVDLVGKVLEAAATLTVGTVTVGAHA